MGRVHLYFTRYRWARANNRHIAFQYIYELWQLVHTELTHKCAEGRYAGILFDLENWPACLIKVQKLSTPRFGIHTHGPELIAVKVPAALTNTYLFKEYWAARGQADAYCEDKVQPGENQKE